MHERTTPECFRLSRTLRNNLTSEEQKLWSAIRNKQLNGVRFRRQHAIGQYIVDFCAPSIKLIIEVDGGQHAVQNANDHQRTQFLESKGYQILRFWNNEIEQNLEGVILVILDVIQKRTPA